VRQLEQELDIVKRQHRSRRSGVNDAGVDNRLGRCR
jgi:hypothetical protein